MPDVACRVPSNGTCVLGRCLRLRYRVPGSVLLVASLLQMLQSGGVSGCRFRRGILRSRDEDAKGYSDFDDSSSNDRTDVLKTTALNDTAMHLLYLLDRLVHIV